MKPGKRPNRADAPPAARPAWRQVMVVLLTLAVVIGVVWGVVQLGDAARRGLGPRERYAVRFSDIDCNPPPGQDRTTFLTEVRYVSRFPESFQSLDPELTSKLKSAFTTHPWVASVESVTVSPDRRVKVVLKHRNPVLVVRLTDGELRTTDKDSVLLPRGAATAGLPELATPVSPPTTDAGQVWADPTVKRAVQLVELHHPIRLEKSTLGWRLTMQDGQVLVVER